MIRIIRNPEVRIKIVILLFLLCFGWILHLFEAFPVNNLKPSDKLNSASSDKSIPRLRNRLAPNLASDSTSTSVKSSNMQFPSIIYGTAWKKEKTKDLVYLAVKTGFRAIDTACQPKHYNEPGVGDALQALYDDQIITRQDLFLQTKFTPIRGQDPNNIPYDKSLPLQQQVQQSFSVSLKNLRTTYLDSILLHSPMEDIEDTLTVWREFEAIYEKGGVRAIGLSNTYNIEVLKHIYNEARVKPVYLQNRFYHDTHYDIDIRAFCRDNGIRYQSFWTLTANPHITKSSIVQKLSALHSKTPAQIFFKFVASQGITPLSGTTSVKHMNEDLEVFAEISSSGQGFNLKNEDIQEIAKLLY